MFTSTFKLPPLLSLPVLLATYAKVFAVGSHKPSRLSEQANKAENFIKNGFRQEEQEQKRKVNRTTDATRPGQRWAGLEIGQRFGHKHDRDINYQLTTANHVSVSWNSIKSPDKARKRESPEERIAGQGYGGTELHV